MNTRDIPNGDDDDDISIIMKTRAGAGGDESKRYSMDAAMNIHILTTSPSTITASGATAGVNGENRNNKNHALIELWRWIARMENQQQQQDTEEFPNMTLTDGGVWRLLEMDQASSDLMPVDEGDTSTTSVVEAECLDLVF
ncbi:hypothetical protein MHU86_756 [Fragilaria crotonensis]|nr:hypothetical protein MHU86_756 [Fragilaria crotonensis]